jgi:hypothetical protein
MEDMNGANQKKSGDIKNIDEIKWSNLEDMGRKECEISSHILLTLKWQDARSKRTSSTSLDGDGAKSSSGKPFRELWSLSLSLSEVRNGMLERENLAGPPGLESATRLRAQGI